MCSMSQTVVIEKQAGASHWSSITVGEEKYQMEIIHSDDNNFDALLHKGSEVQAGGRLAVISKIHNTCLINMYTGQEGSGVAVTIERKLLHDILDITDKLFEGNPVTQYRFR